MPGLAVRTELVGRRVVAVLLAVVGDRQRELFEVSLTVHSARGVPYLLHGVGETVCAGSDNASAERRRNRRRDRRDDMTVPVKGICSLNCRARPPGGQRLSGLRRRSSPSTRSIAARSSCEAFARCSSRYGFTAEPMTRMRVLGHRPDDRVRVEQLRRLAPRTQPGVRPTLVSAVASLPSLNVSVALIEPLSPFAGSTATSPVVVTVPPDAVPGPAFTVNLK